MLDKCWMECSNGFNAIQHFREQRKTLIDVEWKFKTFEILIICSCCHSAAWLKIYKTVQLKLKFYLTSVQHFLYFQQYWTTCSNASDIWFNKVLNAYWGKYWNRSIRWFKLYHHKGDLFGSTFLFGILCRVFPRFSSEPEPFKSQCCSSTFQLCSWVYCAEHFLGFSLRMNH